MPRLLACTGPEDPPIELRDGVFYLRLSLPLAGPVEVALHGVSRKEDALRVRRLFFERFSVDPAEQIQFAAV